MTMGEHARPPRLACRLLAILLPEGWAADSLVADLEEEYRSRLRRGPVRARLWYWRAVLQIGAAYAWERRRRAPGSALLQDLRFAVRSFRRVPGFTSVAAFTLALGIASATSVFSVADAVLLRPLPFPDPDRLVHVWVTEPDRGERREVVAGATYLDWKRDAHSFEGLAGYRRIDFNLTGDELPERVGGVSVTSDFFAVLGVHAALGHLPGRGDTGSDRTVVLTDAFWRSRLGADRAALGSTLVLNGEPHTVVGVLPPGVAFPEASLLYVPSPYRVPLEPLGSEDRSDDRGAGYLSVLGRLAEGVGIEAAQAEMNAIAEEMARAFPETKAGEGVSVVGLQDDLVGSLRATFVVLLGAVGLLLLIACANVANLVTIRASRRRKELAVRVSLGAGLGRIRRQLLTESAVLALCGGVPGFLLAIWGTRLLVAMAPAGIPRLSEVSVDPRVFLFTLIVTLLTGLVFGLAPMVGLEEGTAAAALRGLGGRGRARPERLRDAVVVTEVALSLLLVLGAGLMVRTLRALDGVDPGFEASGVLVAHVSLPESRYPDTDAAAAFYDQCLERIRIIPGVQSAATILTLPMHWAIRGTFAFSIQGRTLEAGEEPLAAYQVASVDYFRTLRVPLLRGRVLDATDRADAPGVVVINEALANRYWPGTDPLGARITFSGSPNDPDAEWATVVGVVGNTVKDGLDRPVEPEAFLPLDQAAMPRSSFVIRTAEDPYALAPAVRQAVHDVDPALPLYDLLSMDDVLAGSLGQRRFRMLLLGAFAGAALLLAAVGLYGVISYAVGQRRREIGIRMALGASRDTVVGRVTRDGLSRVGVGIVLGVLGGLALKPVIAGQVFGVSGADPVTYAASILLLVAAALIAVLAPAVRASRVDPAEAVRDG